MVNKVSYRDPTPNNFPDDYDPAKVDPRVKLRSDSIKGKMFGEETREAMYQALEIGSVTASEANAKADKTAESQDNLNQRVDDQIAANTIKYEEIDFRHSDMLKKTFETMRKRGDFYDNELAGRGVNVKWFGAVGDGVTDDSNAIQAAIDGGYDQIYFPQGTYLVDAPLVIKTRVMLQGSGPRSILIKKSNTTAIGVSSTVAGSAYTFDKPAIINVIFPDDSYFTNFVINNLNFTGNGTNRVLDAPRLAHSQFSKITATNFDYFNQFTDSWMVAFNSIRTTSVNYSFYAIGGTSYHLTNWHADGPVGSVPNVGFYFKDIRYSTLNACGADRMTTSYRFDGSSVVNLSGCGAETTSQAILVLGTATVTLNGCDLEFHTVANMVAQTKYPWLFDGNSKTIINGGTLSFNNYGSITDLSGIYVPILQENAEVRLIDPILNLEGLRGADKQFILKDKAVLKADNLIKSLSYAHPSKISQACYVTPNNLKTLMIIPDFVYGNTLTAKINYQGSSKYSTDSDGVFGTLTAEASVVNYDILKVKINITNTLNCFKGAAIPTPDIRAEIKNNSLYLYLMLTSSSSLPNVINGNLTIEYFVQNNSGIKPDV